MQLIFSLAVFLVPLIGLNAVAQSSLSVTAKIPSDINVVGLEESDLQQLEQEFVVDLPALTGNVRVTMGSFPSDTSFMNRPFPLTSQRWADSTWVAPAAGGGWQIGLGRFLGFDAIYVDVWNESDALIGSGAWTRP